MATRSEQLMSQAYELCNEGRFDEALSCYDQALSLEPENVSAMIDKGATLQNTGRIKESILLYDKALSIDPTNADALLNKGSALHALGIFGKAIDCYDAILRDNERCAMAFAYKGLSLGESGDPRSAILNFKKALAIDSDYDLAIVSMRTAQNLLDSNG